MSVLNMMNEEDVKVLMRECANDGFLQCCCELLRINPVPFLHPIIRMLKVTIICDLTSFTWSSLSLNDLVKS